MAAVSTATEELADGCADLILSCYLTPEIWPSAYLPESHGDTLADHRHDIRRGLAAALRLIAERSHPGERFGLQSWANTIDPEA